ncbi:MAG: hypothetical protein ABSE56_07290 [Bryobacteraceae bacterium]
MKLRICLSLWMACSCWAGTFGRVVTIGGQASDLALDERRGVVYLANFGGNRIEVISTSTLAIQTSMNVAPQPSALALSPDGRFLLVAHFGNFEAPNTPNNLLTLINLDSGGKQTFALGAPPLGVAFGSDNRALVATTTNFLSFDPLSGSTLTLGTVKGVTANTLPAPPANYPPQIVAASLAASGDGKFIYGLTDTIRFKYDVEWRLVTSLGYTANPPMGPRVVSVNRDGSMWAGGWAEFDRDGRLMAQFPNPAGLLEVGSHAIDSGRGLIYAQIPEAASAVGGTPASAPPVLMIVDADNLAVRERLSLPENLAGKSVLASDGSVMYSVSASGLLALPVGSLEQARRVRMSREDLLFQGSFCNRSVATQLIAVTDSSGAATDFALTASAAGIAISPASGVTPAMVTISVDPNAFQNQHGTLTAQITLRSAQAVNLPPPLRVLINNREPDQRGTVVNVPGKLVDLLADPARDRFYVLRQDQNQVLVFEGSGYTQVATLRTGNTPTQMAITFDRRYLLVANDNSQIANVYDLDTLQQQTPIRFPMGHYPRSLASSGRAILGAVRSAASADHKIDRVDLASRTAVELPSLGPWVNQVDLNTVLAASPNGASILAAEADGSLLLYDANADSFTESRKDFTALGGAYAASSQGRFVVDNNLLNASLAMVHQLESETGTSSGFAFVDQYGLRTTAPNAYSPGVIERVDLETGVALNPTRTVEAPNLGQTGAAFTRTLAPLANRNVIVSLSASGFTVLPWNYEAAVPPPHIDAVVNAADFTAAVAPGSLISVFGQNLSPVNLASAEMPLPTALGDSCLTVNGALVPMLFVSPTQVNAQLPYNLDGNVTIVLHTPGGVSDNFVITMADAAPGVFTAILDGTGFTVPTVVRAANNLLVTPSNPVHRGDAIVIYLTGLGRTLPEVVAGAPAPWEPLAVAELAVELDLGGVALPVLYAGLTPGYAGLYQINAQVPSWVPTGMSVRLTIRQGTSSTSLSVRVVE